MKWSTWSLLILLVSFSSIAKVGSERQRWSSVSSLLLTSKEIAQSGADLSARKKLMSPLGDLFSMYRCFVAWNEGESNFDNWIQAWKYVLIAVAENQIEFAKEHCLRHSALKSIDTIIQALTAQMIQICDLNSLLWDSLGYAADIIVGDSQVTEYGRQIPSVVNPDGMLRSLVYGHIGKIATQASIGTTPAFTRWFTRLVSTVWKCLTHISQLP